MKDLQYFSSTVGCEVWTDPTLFELKITINLASNLHSARKAMGKVSSESLDYLFEVANIRI